MQKNTWYIYILFLVVGILIVTMLIVIRAYWRKTPNVVVTPVPTSTVRTGIRGVPTSSWPLYRSDDLQVNVVYPPHMTVHEESGATQFTYWGETQQEGTELYDGISMTLEKVVHRDGKTIDDYIVDKIQGVTSTGNIIGSLSTTTIAGVQSYTMTAHTLGIITYIFIPRSATTTLEISYLDPDPLQKGYESVVADILHSIRFDTAQSVSPTSTLPQEAGDTIHPNITFYDINMASFYSGFI